MSISYQIEKKAMPGSYLVPIAYRVKFSDGSRQYYLMGDSKVAIFGSQDAAAAAADYHIFRLTNANPETETEGWEVCSRKLIRS